MTRVLVVHPRLAPHGGGNSVAVWALQALRGLHEVSLATLEAASPEALNACWGTSLDHRDYRILPMPALWARLRGLWPFSGALLEAALLMRFARRLDRERRFDALISTHNEMDFGRRGLCYVHLPWSFGQESSNGETSSRASRTYRSLCRRIGGATDQGLGRNLLLANSAFTAGRIRSLHGVEARVLFPPITVALPEIPWDERENAVVAVGRMHGCKRWDYAVRIVEELRLRGHNLGLTLIAHRDDLEYQRGLQKLAESRPWFQIRVDLSRREMLEALTRHRYGLHLMIEEHFGMGPAEIVSAGCLLFAHRSGGPMEIVGDAPELLFDTDQGAVDQIERVLLSQGLASRLRAHLAGQRRRFGTDLFCAGIVSAVREFTQGGVA